MMDETIAAISSASGEGGIGIIRISGERAYDICKAIFVPAAGKAIEDYSPRTMMYGHVQDGDIALDEVLAVYMKAPHSYTKEDVVEINCHGGYISLRKILHLILKSGARLAEPGEFTKRAFLNGRLDLSQAEAVMDIIKAKTDSSHSIAQNQLEGGLSAKVRALKASVAAILAHVEVSIDFPEEDIEEITMGVLREKTEQLLEEMQELYKTAHTGKILRDGLSTVIAGKPNVGKSSLLNALIGESRAIVTNIPGTTRDVIEEYINIKGIPLRLVDTAGIRSTEDVVEKIGVEKTRQSIETADLVMLVLDASEKLSSEDIEILELLGDKKCIVIINKTDLAPALDEKEIASYVGGRSIIRISAAESTGIRELENEIAEMVYSGSVAYESSAIISNVRHKHAMEKAIGAAGECIKGIDSGMPLDFVEIDLKNVWDSLGEITGDTVSEDLLDVIFSQFCLGK
ncbi:tRNA modification GTPase MnmE [Peptoclostridium acidaminophilum DSM 3953]|uniref:tRNA modification GTPase MnmE n=2 Tax=Peptoclostridium acidaminophilum TaxID=1731 RepID=W8TI35_PEPAC|nr:tRNA uridine-5-carboxymethylaminomethyl(34) synthesis GTPase MnmE [Peptoclostridium acidaminophilum]AHM57503.1 tRNA modification GTPase MnmE [Peptoclostridium acidaminophilum DSM 3953]